ncbi:MAG: MurR/RpiR family transcriptional regulator [Methanocella sp.]
MNRQVSPAGEGGIRQRIRAAADRLSGAQRTLAEYLLDQPSRAAVLNAGELAAEVGVSAASVVRFAQSLGYDGFLALKRDLQREYLQSVDPADKVKETLAHLGQVPDTFRAVAELEISYLERAIQSIAPADFEAVVKLLGSAHRVGILGPGSSRGLVELLQFRLRRFGVDVLAMTRVGGKDIFEDLHWLKKGDVLLVFAFLQPRPEILTALRYAREAGVKTVAITDLETSPVTTLADVSLVGQRGPVGEFHSLVVPNAVVNALILAYAKYAMPRSLKRLKEFQAIRARFTQE